MLSMVKEVSIEQKLMQHGYYGQLKNMLEERENLIELREKEGIRPVPALRRGLTDAEIINLATQGRSVRGLPVRIVKGMARWIEKEAKIRDLSDQIDQLRRKMIDEIIDSADIVCATHIGAGIDYMKNRSFDCVIMDEATQATPPAQLIPMLLGKQYVFAGDPNQLPPTILSKEAEPVLGKTLFEILMNIHPDKVVLLKRQYRMNERIMLISSELFYNGALEADKSAANRTVENLKGWRGLNCIEKLPDWLREALVPDEPAIFIDVEDSKEEQKIGATSWLNKIEATVVKHVVDALIGCGLCTDDIGVITPYEDQKILLRDLFKEELYKGVEVHTVDGFQGREKEVIIVSLVRANVKGRIGFLVDRRRLNVAITRAKVKLIVVGNLATLSQNTLYKNLLKHPSWHIVKVSSQELLLQEFL